MHAAIEPFQTENNTWLVTIHTIHTATAPCPCCSTYQYIAAGAAQLHAFKAVRHHLLLLSCSVIWFDSVCFVHVIFVSCFMTSEHKLNPLWSLAGYSQFSTAGSCNPCAETWAVSLAVVSSQASGTECTHRQTAYDKLLCCLYVALRYDSIPELPVEHRHKALPLNSQVATNSKFQVRVQYEWTTSGSFVTNTCTAFAGLLIPG